MKIFIAHSSIYNYKQELYSPIQNSNLFRVHTIILPMLHSRYEVSQETIRSCDLVIAEVSFPSTGAGIEIGYADVFKIPIICVYKKGSTPSGALKKITDLFFEYKDANELIELLEIQLENKHK
ncbi:MAG: hypothetical protein KGJ07_01665 [Patescibacteria group bacterium]|nr:hypothetical protein [Patescibacteria group bacterium]MDE2589105.1 hypothetical protein [Patescibacteria group bacterium]